MLTGKLARRANILLTPSLHSQLCPNLIFGGETHDLAFEGWTWRRWCLSVISFLKTLLLENLYYCTCDVKKWLVQIWSLS